MWIKSSTCCTGNNSTPLAWQDAKTRSLYRSERNPVIKLSRRNYEIIRARFAYAASWIASLVILQIAPLTFASHWSLYTRDNERNKSGNDGSFDAALHWRQPWRVKQLNVYQITEKRRNYRRLRNTYVDFVGSGNAVNYKASSVYSGFACYISVT